MVDPSFKDFVLDQLNNIPNVRARRMFSGFGIYAGDAFFAIVSDGVLYLKTNIKTDGDMLKQDQIVSVQA